MWIETLLSDFGFKCISSKHELCYNSNCVCLCHVPSEVNSDEWSFRKFKKDAKRRNANHRFRTWNENRTIQEDKESTYKNWTVEKRKFENKITLLLHLGYLSDFSLVLMKKEFRI